MLATLVGLIRRSFSIGSMRPSTTSLRSSRTVARFTQLPQCHGHCTLWRGWNRTGMQPSSIESIVAFRETLSPALVGKWPLDQRGIKERLAARSNGRNGTYRWAASKRQISSRAPRDPPRAPSRNRTSPSQFCPASRFDPGSCSLRKRARRYESCSGNDERHVAMPWLVCGARALDVCVAHHGFDSGRSSHSASDAAALPRSAAPHGPRRAR